jgi:CubicO group peptidase (beta-lactamase class C family)
MKLRAGTPEKAGMSLARVQHVKELARSWVEDGTHHALVVLVARQGLIVLHEAFGTLRPEPDSPPLPLDAIFPITSATKPVTAAAIMCLVEDGRVGLMRPVRDYYPEISAEGTEELLVHHLLTHLSGWRDLDVQTEIERLLREGVAPPPPEPGQHPLHAGLSRLIRTLPLACGPGEAMQYCQLNYELLVDLLRRVSGTPIERFAQERIFEPLGMGDSSYVLPPEHRERKVRRGEGMPGSEDLGPVSPSYDSELFEGMPSGAGGVHTTARDIAVFAQMLLNSGTYDGRRVLSSASVQAMRRNHVPEGVPARWERLGPDGRPITLEFPGGYGYGLFPFLDTVTPYFNGGLASPSSYSHAGAGGVYFWADPERDLVGVYLSVARRNLEDETTPDWRADIFVDAVTAAVED